MTVLRASVALSLLTFPVSAQGIDGIYDGLSCASEFRSEVSVAIAWPTLDFYETRCTIIGAEFVPGMDSTYSYTASCEGEGEAWTRSYVITPNFEGGIVIVQDGNGQSYDRCGG